MVDFKRLFAEALFCRVQALNRAVKQTGETLRQGFRLCQFCQEDLLLLVAVAVAAHELINATSGVDEFLLAGEEGVRRTCDFKLH